MTNTKFDKWCWGMVFVRYTGNNMLHQSNVPLVIIPITGGRGPKVLGIIVQI